MILARRGYAHLVARLPVPFNLPALQRRRRLAPLPEETRLALEELGPTFVKIGQIASTRRDLLPGEFVRELSLLQDTVKPFAKEEVLRIIGEDLGQDVEDLFERFDREPLGSASIAQVHAARYRGREVVVKVRRPGIESQVSEDIQIMEALARLLHDHISETRIYDLPGLARELGRALRGELNFRREADALDLFARGFEDWNTVRIPRVYRDASSRRVITMDRLYGQRVYHLEDIPEDRRRTLARRALEMSFHQFFDLGFFHADPHPGNLLVMNGDVLGLVDFGRIGVVDDRMEARLAELMAGIIDRDYPLITDVVLDIARPVGEVDELRLLRDLTELVEFNYQKSVDQISVGDILTDLLDLLQRHRLVVSGDYITLVGAVITAESSANALYPGLNPVQEMAPHVRGALRRRLLPKALGRRARRAGRRVVRDAEDVSRDLVNLISQARKGDFTLRFRHVGLESFLFGLEKISRRLTTGLITAALIIAGSLIIGIDRPPLLFGYPALGMMALFVAAILGLWLLFVGR